MNGKNYPKISIITVVFNADETIEQTILSVINQIYKNIEYIIIDGGSTDGTINIIKKYQDKIAYWVSEPDNGIYDAMNKGINVATGDYIYFLGADDWLINNLIVNRVVKEIKAYNEVELFSGRVMLIDNKLKLKKVYGERLTKEGVFKGKMVPHQGLFVKKSILKKLLFNTEYKIAADFDFFLKCIKENAVVFFSKQIIANYSIDGYSSINSLRQAEYKEILAKYNDIYLVDKNEKWKKIIEKMIINLYLSFFIKFIKKRKGWEDIE